MKFACANQSCFSVKNRSLQDKVFFFVPWTAHWHHTEPWSLEGNIQCHHHPECSNFDQQKWLGKGNPTTIFWQSSFLPRCDHRLVDFFAGPAINHWDKWPVVGDDVEFYGNQTGEMIQPQKISSLCTFAEESLRLDVWKPQKSLQHLEFKLLRRRIFPAPNVAIAMQPIFFPSRIFEEDSREGTNGKISHGALVFGWIQNWPPRGRSPCCKLASLPYTVNYKSEKKRIEVFFCQNADWILFGYF